jgi:DNA-directed RNA polymerase II subunit RPB11
MYVYRQLLRDSNVIFSGYQHPHPLVHDIYVRVQTNDNATPVEALVNCLDDLSTEFDEIAQKFRQLTGNSKDQSSFS